MNAMDRKQMTYLADQLESLNKRREAIYSDLLSIPWGTTREQQAARLVELKTIDQQIAKQFAKYGKILSK